LERNALNKSDYFTRLLPEIFKYKVFRHTGLMKINPFTLTFSVTAACQSRCKTCKIGDMYHENPERKKEDLTVGEIESVFKTMKPLYFFNVSGGEPFLRDDLPEIIELACYYLKPRIVHIPTNALMPKKIFQKTNDILAIIDVKYKGTILTVKPSIDGIGEEHDKIRGVKGNFERLLETLELLKQLVAEYDSFHLELGTVVSNYNIDHLEEIEDFVHSLDIESYRNEIAEQRSEFFNVGDPITPTAEVYERIIKDFSQKIVSNISKKKKLTKATEALRLAYYQLSSRILKENRQVIPCYACISNVHINYDGGVWPCCVLGYEQEIGNLRNCNYDFQQLWYSDEAKKVRHYIKNNACACPLANQTYSNMLIDFKSMLKAVYFTLLLSMKR
jgi:MoaA/NifB/PqqE/SkfB family radical SAM enzyme